MSWNSYGFRPYVPVAERRQKAARAMAARARKGEIIRPVVLKDRTIARSFWGKSWCDNLESYSDYENRLPRGRTYVRNGSVVHLEVLPGLVKASVSGSELYKTEIRIVPVSPPKWKRLCAQCAGEIGSLVELLQGRLSTQVMDVITRQETGLFPSPHEINLKCSCPDSALMCKHVAAALYGVGARLDESPELLFLLRSADHQELITQAAQAAGWKGRSAPAGPEIAERDIGAVFGIELDSTPAASPAKPVKAPAQKKPRKPAAPVKTSKPAPAKSKKPARPAKSPQKA